MMKGNVIAISGLVAFCTVGVRAQNEPEKTASVPLYRVTVIDRTVSAVDYQYLNGPTKIDFRGTVLLPKAKGEATVESKKGRTEIEAKFDRLAAPTRFGPEYLTYVLWAITPEGHAKNLGEILPGSSDKAKLRVTTDLQAFGLVVTAEPYSAVRLPSNVVVLENHIRPDTTGKVEPIQAKYELLPRGHYTYTVPINSQQAEGNGPMLSMDQYQSVVELYQAQNAIQIAQSAGADQYAPDTFRKAEDLLRQAQDAQARKAGMTTIVTTARQAAQTAEDARILAIQRKQQDELAKTKDELAKAQAQKMQAEAAAQTAKTQAAADRALLERDRAERQRAESEVNLAAAAPAPAPEPATPPQPLPGADSQQRSALRMRLFEQLNSVLPSRDTPRGLVVVIPDADFQGRNPRAGVNDNLARIAAIIKAHPGLIVEVGGYELFASDRANAVRELLVRDGVPANAVVARDFGDERPIATGTTASGREQNRRVEITIAGNSIGDLPYWAKTYSLVPPQQ
jgi:flagellar motor protein MotB